MHGPVVPPQDARTDIVDLFLQRSGLRRVHQPDRRGCSGSSGQRVVPAEVADHRSRGRELRARVYGAFVMLAQTTGGADETVDHVSERSTVTFARELNHTLWVVRLWTSLMHGEWWMGMR